MRGCMLSPETRSSTHFFWNYLHNYDLDDPTIALSLRDSMIEGFNEDRSIIEEQQKTFDADPDFKMHGIAADAPLAHFRWTLGRMIEEERWRAAPLYFLLKISWDGGSSGDGTDRPPP